MRKSPSNFGHFVNSRPWSLSFIIINNYADIFPPWNQFLISHHNPLRLSRETVSSPGNEGGVNTIFIQIREAKMMSENAVKPPHKMAR